MQVVDGQSGGGQVVRAAVTSAALTETPVLVENARAARDQRGLKAQHVAAIDAVAQVCDAETANVDIGAVEFEFAPGQPRGGEFEVDIGTAGSITLVFDAVLPIATTLDAPVSLAVTGGTDVAWAPTIEYYRHVKLPLLRDVGVDAHVTLARRGFYPAGGGRATLHVEPADEIQPLDLARRGELARVSIRSTAARALSTAEVAERQATEATDQLPRDVPSSRYVAYVESDSPGSVVDLVAEYAHSRAGFSALGERGKPAESVAQDAVDAFVAFQETDAAVDRHLADQLLPFLALAGGRVRVPAVTAHVETHTDLLRQFGHEILIDESDGVVLSSPASE